jgi:hypothetical protein
MATIRDHGHAEILSDTPLIPDPVSVTMLAAETRPRAERTDPQDPRGRCVCPKRWKYAALAVPGRPRSEGQGDCRSLLQTRMG